MYNLEEIMKKMDIKSWDKVNFSTEYNPKFISDHRYFVLGCSEDFMKCVKEEILEDSDIQRYENLDHPTKWTVYLSKNNSKLTVLPKLKDTNFSKAKNGMDKGHLIAKCFQDYLINSSKGNTEEFFYKNKRENIIYQYKDANRGNGDIWGQWHFEDIVKHKLESGDDVWYQVEPIFLKKDKEIPIGTRVLAFLDSSKSENFKLEEVRGLPFHVFVPNVGENSVEYKN